MRRKPFNAMLAIVLIGAVIAAVIWMLFVF